MAYPRFPEPIAPSPINPILTRSLAPRILPGNSEAVSAAPAVERTLRREREFFMAFRVSSLRSGRNRVLLAPPLGRHFNSITLRNNVSYQLDKVLEFYGQANIREV